LVDEVTHFAAPVGGLFVKLVANNKENLVFKLKALIVEHPE